MNEANLDTLRRKRGIVRTSITCIATRLRELEGKADSPSMLSHAHHMFKRLEALNADFKTHHLAVVDTIGDDNVDSLAQEQNVLDTHDDEVASLSYNLKQLTRPRTTGADAGSQVIAMRRLSQLETKLSTLKTAVEKLTGNPSEIHLVHFYQEQLSDCKGELGGIHTAVLSLTVDESTYGWEGRQRHI